MKVTRAILCLLGALALVMASAPTALATEEDDEFRSKLDGSDAIAAANETLSVGNETAEANTTATTEDASPDTIADNVDCVDDLWDAADTTCEDHKGWDQCFDDFMVIKGENEENDVIGVQSYCAKTCERCPGDVWDPALYYEKTGRSLYLGKDAVIDSCKNEEGLTCEAPPPEEEAAADEEGGEDGQTTDADVIGDKFDEEETTTLQGGKSPGECRAGFASLGDLRGLQQNDDLMACATGTGASCCRGVNSYLGEGSALYGCGCQPGLLREALGEVPGFVRPIIERAINACDIPTTDNGGCTS